MTTRVVNLSSGEPFDVYIGRAGHGYDGYFGNPFELRRDTPVVRAAVLREFREWFLERVESDGRYRARVLALRGKTLACPGNCKPKPCHGDVIVWWLEEQPVTCDAPCQRRVLAHPEYGAPCPGDCPRAAGLPYGAGDPAGMPPHDPTDPYDDGK